MSEFAAVNSAKNRARPERNDRARAASVSFAPGAIRIDATRVFGVSDRGNLRRFLEAAFSLPVVESIEVDRLAGSAEIRVAGAGVSPEGVLARLADVLAGERADCRSTWVSEIPNEWRWTMARFGRVATTWRIAHSVAGRIRLRHDRIGRDAAFRSRAVEAMRALEGVELAKARASTCGLLVSFDPARIDAEELVARLDRELNLHGSDVVACRESGRNAGESKRGPAQSVDSGSAIGRLNGPRFGVATTSVALAALGEFVAPVVLPLSAALLVYSAAPAVIETGRALVRERRVGLPALSTAIVGATLASGQFLPASLMAWCGEFWRWRHREAIGEVRRDGLAHSEVGDGPWREHLIAATAPAPSRWTLSREGEAFAERSVWPVLGVGTIGLLAAGAGQAAAIMRPDYATGRSLGGSVYRARCCVEAAKEGVLVWDASIFERIHACSIVVMDWDVIACRLDLVEAAAALRGMGYTLIAMSSHTHSEWQSEAIERGANSCVGGLDDQRRARWIDSTEASGGRVLYLGEGDQTPLAARAAWVAVDVARGSSEIDPGGGASHARFRVSSARGIAALRKLSLAERLAMRRMERWTCGANLAAAAGALFLGTPGLASVALTNAGILAVDIESRRPLRLNSDRSARRDENEQKGNGR